MTNSTPWLEATIFPLYYISFPTVCHYVFPTFFRIFFLPFFHVQLIPWSVKIIPWLPPLPRTPDAKWERGVGFTRTHPLAGSFTLLP